MSFKDQLLADGPLFANPEEFGEEVTYTQAGVQTVMDAVVIRGDMARVLAVGGRSYAGIMVKLMIPVATLPQIKKLDTVAIRLRATDAADTVFRIGKVLDQDDGMWTLEAEG